MKYAYIVLVFILGVALGRWSAPSAEKVQPRSEVAAIAESLPVGAEKKIQMGEEKVLRQNAIAPSNPSIVRTEDSVRDRKMRELYDQLQEASKRDDIGEQNGILAEMEKLDSKHEKVFQARTEFLQDDNDWEGAHKVLVECAATIPNSTYCLRRLTNIRSSTNDDKIRYGMECLRVSKNDQMCMVDLALALHSKGQFTKAKDYFEQTLNLPMGSEGFSREHILYWYGMTLESLNQHQKAKAVFTESCKLGNGSACIKIRS